jgi:putative inorganic carbon (HCO3(-)) transporter
MMRGGLVRLPVPAPELRAATPTVVPVTGAAERQRVADTARPDALLYVVLGVVLTDVWRLHDLVPATRVLRPSLALTALGLALIVAGGDSSRALRRLRSPVSLWLALFVGLMLASLPFSLDPAQSTRFFISNFLPHAMAGLLVAVSVRSVRDAEFLAFGTLIGACVHTLFIHATVPMGVDRRWTLLPFYDVNDLALMLVAMIPLTVYFMRRGNSMPRRVFAVACFALFAYSIVPTGSRGGFLGFAIVLAYLLLRYEAVSPRARLVAAVVAGLALAVGGHAYANRLETIVRPGQDYNWSEETGRLAIWRRGVGYVARRPLVGLGLNQFRTAEATLWPLVRTERMAGRRPPRARGAHNMLIQVGAELGVPALLAFVVLLGIAWRTLKRVRDVRDADGSPGPALSGAIAASLLGFCVCGIFLHAAFFPILPMLLGFAVALANVYGGRAYTHRARRGGLAAYREAPREAPRAAPV